MRPPLDGEPADCTLCGEISVPPAGSDEANWVCMVCAESLWPSRPTS